MCGALLEEHGNKGSRPGFWLITTDPLYILQVRFLLQKMKKLASAIHSNKKSRSFSVKKLSNIHQRTSLSLILLT